MRNFVTLLLFAVVACIYGFDSCQDDSQKIEHCKVKYSTCVHYNPGEEYQTKAYVTDDDGNANEKSDWHMHADSAVYEATYKLFYKDLDSHSYMRNDCNCEISDIDQGPCQLRVAVCFYFCDSGDVKKEVNSSHTFYMCSSLFNTQY